MDSLKPLVPFKGGRSIFKSVEFESTLRDILDVALPILRDDSLELAGHMLLSIEGLALKSEEAASEIHFNYWPLLAAVEARPEIFPILQTSIRRLKNKIQSVNDDGSALYALLSNDTNLVDRAISNFETDNKGWNRLGKVAWKVKDLDNEITKLRRNDSDDTKSTTNGPDDIREDLLTASQEVRQIAPRTDYLVLKQLRDRGVPRQSLVDGDYLDVWRSFLEDISLNQIAQWQLDWDSLGEIANLAWNALYGYAEDIWNNAGEFVTRLADGEIALEIIVDPTGQLRRVINDDTGKIVTSYVRGGIESLRELEVGDILQFRQTWDAATGYAEETFANGTRFVERRFQGLGALATQSVFAGADNTIRQTFEGGREVLRETIRAGELFFKQFWDIENAQYIEELFDGLDSTRRFFDNARSLFQQDQLTDGFVTLRERFTSGFRELLERYEPGQAGAWFRQTWDQAGKSIISRFDSVGFKFWEEEQLNGVKQKVTDFFSSGERIETLFAPDGARLLRSNFKAAGDSVKEIIEDFVALTYLLRERSGREILRQLNSGGQIFVETVTNPTGSEVNRIVKNFVDNAEEIFRSNSVRELIRYGTNPFRGHKVFREVVNAPGSPVARVEYFYVGGERLETIHTFQTSGRFIEERISINGEKVREVRNSVDDYFNPQIPPLQRTVFDSFGKKIVSDNYTKWFG